MQTTHRENWNKLLEFICLHRPGDIEVVRDQRGVITHVRRIQDFKLAAWGGTIERIPVPIPSLCQCEMGTRAHALYTLCFEDTKKSTKRRRLPRWATYSLFFLIFLFTLMAASICASRRLNMLNSIPREQWTPQIVFQTLLNPFAN